MPLTSHDVATRAFTKARNGYETEEVDDFLQLVTNQMEEDSLISARLQLKADSLTRELEQYKSLEGALKEALVVAQVTASEVRRNAEAEAELLLTDARYRADRIMEDAIGGVEKIRQQRLHLAWEMRAALQTHLEYLQAEIDRLSAPSPSQLPQEVKVYSNGTSHYENGQGSTELKPRFESRVVDASRQ